MYRHVVFATSTPGTYRMTVFGDWRQILAGVHLTDKQYVTNTFTRSLDAAVNAKPQLPLYKLANAVDDGLIVIH